MIPPIDGLGHQPAGIGLRRGEGLEPLAMIGRGLPWFELRERFGEGRVAGEEPP